MAAIPDRLYQGQPGTTEGTIYTVPTSYTNPWTNASETVRRVILKQIFLANNASSAATVSISLVPSGGAASNANRIVPNVSVPANSVVTIDMSQVMRPDDFLSAVQGTSGAITVTISGVVVT